jgi:hypothetical protein
MGVPTPVADKATPPVTSAPPIAAPVRPDLTEPLVPSAKFLTALTTVLPVLMIVPHNNT